MASNVLLTKGSKLYRKNPTTSVYEEVIQCLTLAWPSTVQEWIDITNHSSSGGYKEYAPGLKDVATFDAEIFWNPRSIAMHGTIYDDAVAEPPILRSWGIILPNALDGVGFSAFLSSPKSELGSNPAAAVKMSFTMRVSGAPTRVTTGTAGLP